MSKVGQKHLLKALQNKLFSFFQGSFMLLHKETE